MIWYFRLEEESYMNYDLKNMIECAMRACESFDEKIGLPMPSRQIMKVDMLNFILYLAAADNTLAPEEVDFVRDYLDLDASPSDLSKFIVDHNLHTDDYLKDTPLSLNIFVRVDNEMYRANPDSPDLCSLYVRTFEILGKYFINIDNNVEKSETSSLNAALHKMLIYIDVNSSRYLHTKADTILENNNDVSVSVDVGMEKLNLWGREIAVPEADLVNEYLETMKDIQDCYQLLDGIIKKQVTESKKEGYNFIQVKFYFDIYSYTDNGQYINHLLSVIEEDSYDVCPTGDTREKYCEWTQAYKGLTELKRILVREAQQLNDAHESAMESGCAEAYRQAASQITGMRYGIITNSAVDLLAYNAISNLTLRSQAKKADEQYSKMVSSMAKRNIGIYRSNLESLMYEQYVPAARNAIKLWANEVTEKVCEYKANHGNSVFGDAYNIDESIAIINTIQSRDSEESKKDKLVEAIKKCPYNDEIYYKILDMGLMTSEIYDYAKRYSFLRTDLEKNIEQKIIKKCITRLADIDFIKTHLGFINDYAKRQRFLNEIYALPIGKVKEKYGALKEYSSGKNILGFLKCNLGISKEENFVSMSKEQVSQKLKEYINLIIDRKMWYILIEQDFVNINQITGVNSTDYDYVNDYFFDKINGILIEYLRAMKDKNQDIQQKREIINSKLAESQRKLEEINEKIASLRFFDRKLKKELSEKKAAEIKIQVECKDELQKLILKWI